MWVTDASKGLCRMDVAGGGGGAGFTLTNCVLPATSLVGVKAVLGQPAFDVATQSVYVPDMSSGSKGIWRYSFTGTTFGISTSGVNIAAAAGLGGQRPGAVVLGDDGNLYASMSATPNIVRVNAPSVGTAQTVDSIATTLSRSPARGMAFSAHSFDRRYGRRIRHCRRVRHHAGCATLSGYSQPPLHRVTP